MDQLFTIDALTSLMALSFMEILLGIDNVIFVSIVMGRLHDPAQKRKAGIIWMVAGIAVRLVLLFFLSQLIAKETALFDLGEHPVSLKDIITLGGGLFLLVNTTMEIHNKLEGEDPNQKAKKGKSTFSAIVGQIILIDIVFSFDGIITALGMVRETASLSGDTVFMIRTVAVMIAMAVMFIFAPRISSFIHKHPTFKMLALSFLILIAVLLIVEGIHVEKIHIPHGYIYFAMAFSFGVEMLNLQVRKKAKPVELREPHLEENPQKNGSR
jgi:predicted tellurium resistance membrane protein TerC